jgi:hypothetical protein
MPEIILKVREANSDESTFLFFTDRGDETIRSFRSHLIDDADHLARQQGSIHHEERPVGAYELRNGLQIDGFAFGHLTTNFQRYFESDANCSTTLRVSRPMHEPALEGA